ncbi:hypothetical protein BDW71DRAFT_62000 [Aspergillus fruticulosus]
MAVIFGSLYSRFCILLFARWLSVSAHWGFGPLLLNNLLVQTIFDMILIQGYTVDMVTWDFLPLFLIKGLGGYGHHLSAGTAPLDCVFVRCKKIPHLFLVSACMAGACHVR